MPRLLDAPLLSAARLYHFVQRWSTICAVRNGRAFSVSAASVFVDVAHGPEPAGVEQQRLPVPVIQMLDLTDPQHVITRAMRIDDPARYMRERAVEQRQPLAPDEPRLHR